jgi:putative adhesin
MRICLAASVFVLLIAPAARAQSTDFHWSGQIQRGKAIEIKGVNGGIHAEFTSGNEVEVTAVKSARRSDVSSVSVQVVQNEGNVTICAVYPTPDRLWSSRNSRNGRDNEPNQCRPGSAGHMNVNDNDVRVEFTVKVPAGVTFYGKTVNGNIDAAALRSDSAVETVNGKIALETTGTGSAVTVNGSIDASVGASSWNETLEFRTVNGSINLRLPKNVEANVHAGTLNGGFQSDFPLMVKSFGGRNHHVDGTIGKGGRDLDLHTVNGRIQLQSVPQ